jgi:hypothetical protein
MYSVHSTSADERIKGIPHFRYSVSDSCIPFWLFLSF